MRGFDVLVGKHKVFVDAIVRADDAGGGEAWLVFCVFGAEVEKNFGGVAELGFLACVDLFEGCAMLEILMIFNFGEDNFVALKTNKVDFAEASFEILQEDGVAALLKHFGDGGFGAMAESGVVAAELFRRRARLRLWRFWFCGIFGETGFWLFWTFGEAGFWLF